MPCDHAPDLQAAQRIAADALPPMLASVMPPEHLELMRQKLHLLPKPPKRPRPTGRLDWRPRPVFTQFPFDLSNCDPVHFHGRRQFGVCVSPTLLPSSCYSSALSIW